MKKLQRGELKYIRFWLRWMMGGAVCDEIQESRNDENRWWEFRSGFVVLFRAVVKTGNQPRALLKLLKSAVSLVIAHATHSSHVCWWGGSGVQPLWRRGSWSWWICVSRTVCCATGRQQLLPCQTNHKARSVSNVERIWKKCFIIITDRIWLWGRLAGVISLS